MGNDITQFRSASDDCVYFYDLKAKRFRKMCDIPSFEMLPLDVKSQIREARLEAKNIMDIPEE
jgi:hypothetical protein